MKQKLKSLMVAGALAVVAAPASGGTAGDTPLPSKNGTGSYDVDAQCCIVSGRNDAPSGNVRLRYCFNDNVVLEETRGEKGFEGRILSRISEVTDKDEQGFIKQGYDRLKSKQPDNTCKPPVFKTTAK